MEGRLVSQIGPGLLCYIGVGQQDGADDIAYMCAGVAVGDLIVIILMTTVRLPPKRCMHAGDRCAQAAATVPSPGSVRKLLGMRIWPSEDQARPWHLNVAQLPGSILCVSQFTLFGRLNGNKPDHSRAAPPAAAQQLYNEFLATLRAQHGHDRVSDGVFGAMMQVASVNDGPVTWLLDSADRNK